MEWEYKFRNVILDRGMDYYENGAVHLISNEGGIIYATVAGSGTRLYSVTLEIQNDELISSSCTCPYAEDGHMCKHMAAVLFTVEDDLDIIDTGGAVEEVDRDARKIQNGAEKFFRRLDMGYQYYDLQAITESCAFSPELWDQGMALADSGKLRLSNIESRFRQSGIGQNLIVNGAVDNSKYNDGNDVELRADRNDLLEANCWCPDCSSRWSGHYGYGYSRIMGCEHLVALIILAARYMKDNPIGDNTDVRGLMIMRSYGSAAVARAEDRQGRLAGDVTLEPRIEYKKGNLELTFRIGIDKMFVIKNLSEFVRLVKESGIAEYGSGASAVEIPHGRGCFDDSERYIDYIERYVAEEEMFREKAGEKYRANIKTDVGKSLDLFGSRLDEFYELLEGNKVEFTDKERYSKKQAIQPVDGRYEPVMEIRIDKGSDEFDGLTVESDLSGIFTGTRHAYYIGSEGFLRESEEFSRDIRPLLENARGKILRFSIGRSKMSDFYYTMLPKLRDTFDVRGEIEDEIEAFIPPEASFEFYLDAENDDVTCKALSIYGDKKYLISESTDMVSREDVKEALVLQTLMNWFTSYDEETGLYYCDSDEGKIYDLLENGLDRLLDIGEVNTTDRFKHLKVRSKTKVSIGVSLDNGLLDLSIATTDVEPEELMEILSGYKTRRKYYRLKNGDFINTEDPNLKTLGEMVSVLNISAEDLKKGSLKIPAYRALYLDSLLAESDDIYADRDRHYRELVKSFKTVSESDFEEPASLKNVLRNYQKSGFRWLSTVEAYGLGGILADDMGLGKTVQMISVILSYKEKAGDESQPSLIVTPASLIYNWEEEFRRFAPNLKILLVAGGQGERRKLIDKYRDYDVLVTSYDLLKRDIAKYKDKTFHYQVIDEGQFIKNHSTAAAKSVKVINSSVRFALTGTPIENRLSELWSIFDYLMPGFLYTYEQFRKNFETPIVKSRDEETIARLQKMVAPFILRRLKKEVLRELPDKIEKVRPEQMEGRQRELYDAQVLHMKKTLQTQDEGDFNKSKIQILSELTRLRQICCDPSLCFEDYDGPSAKREGCMELIESAVEGEHKMLLFSQFTSMLDVLKKDLDKAGIRYHVITGATPKEQRLRLVNEFNHDDVPVFLISLKAGGTGLNLIGADIVIHYDPWWNLAVQNQATDRAHRIGQTKVVTEYKLIAKNTIEEKIVELQEKKRDLADQIISGEGSEASLASMSKDDLLELLG